MRILLLAALAFVPILAADAPAAAPLAAAVKAGQRAAAIDMIAKKSADVNASEADGSTALLWAANGNDADLVVRLQSASDQPWLLPVRTGRNVGRVMVRASA